MTNSELLKTQNESILSSLDKQRQNILRLLIQKRPCPNCATQVNWFDAVGVKLDDLDLINDATRDSTGKCPECKRGLTYTVPMLPGSWRWTLVPIDMEW
jgi:hypothetical protein